MFLSFFSLAHLFIVFFFFSSCVFVWLPVFIIDSFKNAYKVDIVPEVSAKKVIIILCTFIVQFFLMFGNHFLSSFHSIDLSLSQSELVKWSDSKNHLLLMCVEKKKNFCIYYATKMHFYDWCSWETGLSQLLVRTNKSFFLNFTIYFGLVNKNWTKHKIEMLRLSNREATTKEHKRQQCSDAPNSDSYRRSDCVAEKFVNRQKRCETKSGPNCIFLSKSSSLLLLCPSLLLIPNVLLFNNVFCCTMNGTKWYKTQIIFMLYCVYVIWCDLILNSEWSVVALRRQNLRFFGCVLAQLCHSDIQQHQTEVEKKPYTEGKKKQQQHWNKRGNWNENTDISRYFSYCVYAGRSS